MLVRTIHPDPMTGKVGLDLGFGWNLAKEKNGREFILDLLALAQDSLEKSSSDKQDIENR